MQIDEKGIENLLTYIGVREPFHASWLKNQLNIFQFGTIQMTTTTYGTQSCLNQTWCNESSSLKFLLVYMNNMNKLT
jgi:hypothetical protein